MRFWNFVKEQMDEAPESFLREFYSEISMEWVPMFEWIETIRALRSEINTAVEKLIKDGSLKTKKEAEIFICGSSCLQLINYLHDQYFPGVNHLAYPAVLFGVGAVHIVDENLGMKVAIKLNSLAGKHAACPRCKEIRYTLRDKEICNYCDASINNESH